MDGLLDIHAGERVGILGKRRRENHPFPAAWRASTRRTRENFLSPRKARGPYIPDTFVPGRYTVEDV